MPVLVGANAAPPMQAGDETVLPMQAGDETVLPVQTGSDAAVPMHAETDAAAPISQGIQDGSVPLDAAVAQPPLQDDAASPPVDASNVDASPVDTSNAHASSMDAGGSEQLPLPLNDAGATAAGVKWHPGNYMYTAHPDDPSEVAAALDSPAIVGIQVRYFWAKPGEAVLEPRKGVYDLSGLEANLADYQAAGKRLHLLIFDQDYWGAQCVPGYMWDPQDPDFDPVYEGGSVRQGDRCVPKYWVPAVMDRILALYRALGARFDGEPYFEAISTHESAASGGLGDESYSDAAYVQQLVREQEGLAEAFPHTLAFVHLNFAPRLPSLVEHAQALGLGVDGPDLFVSGSSVGRTSWAYPCFNQSFQRPEYAGQSCEVAFFQQMPLGMGGQVGLEKSIQAGYTAAQLYHFALTDPERLRLTHMAWSRPYQTPGFTFDGTLLPYIESVDGAQLNRGCPQNLLELRGGCISE